MLAAQQSSSWRMSKGRPRNSGPPLSNGDRPIRISGGVMAGELVNRVEPVSPETDAQGTVVLHAIIAPDGTVHSSPSFQDQRLCSRRSRRRSPVDLQALPAERKSCCCRHNHHRELQTLISVLCFLISAYTGAETPRPASVFTICPSRMCRMRSAIVAASGLCVIISTV